jgi:O-antigen ligase
LQAKKITLSSESLFSSCILLFPILTLAVKKWMNSLLFFTLAMAIYIIFKNKKQGIPLLPKSISKHWIIWISIALASPLIAVLIAQLLRHEISGSNCDSASRLFFSIPILYIIIQRKINFSNCLKYTAPLANFMTLLSITIKPNLEWGIGRMTTYFVDPLSFGNISLTLAIISLVTINLSEKNRLLNLYALFGFCVGMYLSIISGSRTGWLAIPLVMWLWLYSQVNRHKLIVIVLPIIACTLFYTFIPIIHNRINTGIHDILIYKWNHINADTSVGMRISFMRIGLFLFFENPIAGWGDTGFKNLLSHPQLTQFSTTYTRQFVLTAGFHNEIITNMVRSGIWGLVASILIFIAPLSLFIKGLFSNYSIVRQTALLSTCYLICVFISGMTTEVFNIKLTTSFHAMMMVSLMGSLLVLMHTHIETE